MIIIQNVKTLRQITTAGDQQYHSILAKKIGVEELRRKRERKTEENEAENTKYSSSTAIERPRGLLANKTFFDKSLTSMLYV